MLMAAQRAWDLAYAERVRYNKDDDDCPVIGCTSDGLCPEHDEAAAS